MDDTNNCAHNGTLAEFNYVLILHHSLEMEQIMLMSNCLLTTAPLLMASNGQKLEWN